VPVAAAGLAEVGTGDDRPRVALRSGDHLPQPLAVGGLEIGTGGETGARLRDPIGKLVAQALELTEVEDARLGGAGPDAVLDFHPAEALGEEASQLMLEASDLAAQLAPSQPLVDADVQCLETVSLQQFPHSSLRV
jgi:hypothetical protein